MVEDDASVRTVVIRILESAGYRVRVAHDGAEALAICRREGDAIELVLTDVVMPVLGGAALGRTLRDERPRLPVIYMSGYPDELAASLGGDAYVIAKPFDAKLVLSKVGEQLRAGRAIAQT